MLVTAVLIASIGLVQAQIANFTTSLDTIRDDQNVPGLLLMSTLPDQNEEILAVGARKYGEMPRLQTNDSLHLGSNTKAMTATLTAKLIENGTLSWNTTISDGFAGSSIEVHPAYRNVTVEMLASHRSGLTNDTTLGDQQFWLGLVNASEVEGRAQYVARALSQEPAQAVPLYSYSNANYIVLGHMIDRLAGPWEQIITSELFGPLGMSACGFGAAPQSAPEAIDNPWPHQAGPNGVPEAVASNSDNPPLVGPAGTVHCSASSYAKFLRQHLSALLGTGNSSYLQSESWAKLHTPYDGPGERYTPGGWQLPEEGEGGMSLWHAGSNTYNFAVVYLLPETRRAIFSFTNIYGNSGTRAATSAIRQYLRSVGAPFDEQGSPSAANDAKTFSSLAVILAITTFLLGFA